MTPAEVLRAAAAKLEGGHWTQGFDARDADGIEALPTSRRAVSWSAWGAVVSIEKWPPCRHCGVLSTMGGDGIVAYNDAPGRTEAEVVAMMRATADRLDGAL